MQNCVKMMEDEDLETGAVSMYAQPLGVKYDFYISGPIGSASSYSQMVQVIRDANENDQIFLHINSPGGDLFTALQIIRAINDSKGPVIGSLEGIAASAAGLLFLSCDYYQISEFSTFMAHNYSTGTYGKGGELYDQIVYQRQWSTDLVHRMYEGFLTSKEIHALLESKDIWLGTEEISRRLDKKIHKEQKLMKKMLAEQSKEMNNEQR